MRSNLISCPDFLNPKRTAPTQVRAAAVVTSGSEAVVIGACGSRVMLRAWVAMACFVLGLAIFAGTSLAGTVHGRAVQKTYGPKGDVLETRETAFRITVAGDDYSMEVVPTNAVPGEAVRPSNYWTRAGGTLYRSEISNAPVDDERAFEIQSMGYLYDEVMPVAGEDCSPVLWLVYAWNSHIRGDRDGLRLRPVWETDHEGPAKNALTVPVKLGFSSAFAGRPDRIAFMNEGRTRVRDIDGRLLDRPAPAPFDRGYINATVDISPRFGSASAVPGGAIYRRYSPNMKGAASTNDVWLVESVDIVTVDYAPESEAVTLPKLLPFSALHDYRGIRRMPDFTPMYQIVSNGQWTLPNPKLMARLRREFLKSNAPPETSSTGGESKLPPVLPVAGVLAAGAAAGVLVGRRGARKV